MYYFLQSFLRDNVNKCHSWLQSYHNRQDSSIHIWWTMHCTRLQTTTILSVRPLLLEKHYMHVCHHLDINEKKNVPKYWKISFIKSTLFALGLWATKISQMVKNMYSSLILLVLQQEMSEKPIWPWRNSSQLNVIIDLYSSYFLPHTCMHFPLLW